MTDFSTAQLTFEPRDGKLLARHDGRHFYTLDGAVTAERDDQHGGYTFLDEQGCIRSFITDAFLRRIHRDVEAAPEHLQVALDLAATLLPA